jgi:4-diphosphocytidyl-2-C-methyl-D-erythritol kinase
MVRLLSAAAPAKINLFLRVTGRRPNGYHELDSIFVPISLCDQIRIEQRPASGCFVTFHSNVDALPLDDRNLAVRAALAFMTEFAIEADVRLDLQKIIPIGAGLGGGSSDAGTVLRMMASLNRIGARHALTEIAMRLGADVPFFLDPVAARVRGIGEQLAPLAAFPRLALVVAVPPIEALTGEIFRELLPDHWSGPAPDEDVLALLDGRVTSSILVNDLARVAIAKWPVIARYQALVAKCGARASAMTGSGSAIFGVFDSIAEAAAAAVELRRRAPEARIFDVSSLA